MIVTVLWIIKKYFAQNLNCMFIRKTRVHLNGLDLKWDLVDDGKLLSLYRNDFVFNDTDFLMEEISNLQRRGWKKHQNTFAYLLRARMKKDQ